MTGRVELIPVFLELIKRNVGVDGERHLNSTTTCQESLETIHSFMWVSHVFERIVEHDDVKFACHFVDSLLENLNAVFVRDIFFDERVATGEALNSRSCRHTA